MITHLIFSQSTDKPIKFFDTYNPTEIKDAIIKHLNDYPKDTVEHCKTDAIGEHKLNTGYDIINFYEVNPKNNKPSLVIIRGNHTYYKTLD